MAYPNIFEGWVSALHTVDGALSILLIEQVYIYVMVDGTLFKVTHATTQTHNITLYTLSHTFCVFQQRY